MRSLWRRSRQDWWKTAKRVWLLSREAEIAGRSNELAYSFLFAIIPLLYFLTTLLGYAAAPNDRLNRFLFSYLRGFAPSPEIPALLTSTMSEVAQQHGGLRLSVSFLIALWAASSGTLAYGRILNTALGFKETRPWWWRRLLAVGLTVAFGVLCVTSLSMLFYGRQIGEMLANQVGEGPVFVASWQTLKWPVALLFVLISFELIYNFAPNHRRSQLRWGTPGAVIAITAWLLASFGLKVYLAEVPTSAGAYGSIGAVILLLIWLWVTALAILLGGLVNLELDRQAPGAVRRSRD